MRLGTAFHEVMERVDLKGLAGLDELLREAGTRNNLDGASRLKLGDMIDKCLSSDLMLRARAAQSEGRRVLREMPFTRPLECGGVMEGRIDLLFEEESAWMIVDYKTGRISPDMKEAEKMEEYFRNRYAGQIQTYRNALENLSINVGGVFLLLARTGGVVKM
jgi:ATP-dependent helicase/nuclease subunit A